jgi:hypothetical protein
MVLHMQQGVLFKDDKKNNKQVDLKSGLTLELVGGLGKQAKTLILYRQGVMVKRIDQSDRTAKRVFVVEAIELGAGKSAMVTNVGWTRKISMLQGLSYHTLSICPTFSFEQ